MRALMIPLLLAPCLFAQPYFPSGALNEDPLYSRHLKALREPSLWELSQKDPHAEVYRFLWLRSFHHPISVRIVVRQGGSGWLHSRMTSGKGGAEPGHILHYGRSWMTKSRTQTLVASFERAGFWRLPTLPEANPAVVELDGAEWIFEGVQNGKYHVVERWSPPAGDAIRAAGELALKLARLRVRRAEIY